MGESERKPKSSKLINLLKYAIPPTLGIATTKGVYFITNSEIIVKDPLIESLSWGFIATLVSGAACYFHKDLFFKMPNHYGDLSAQPPGKDSI